MMREYYHWRAREKRWVRGRCGEVCAQEARESLWLNDDNNTTMRDCSEDERGKEMTYILMRGNASAVGVRQK